MKSTKNLVNNLLNDDYRKANVDLQKAVDHVIRARIEKKKQDYISKISQ